MHNKANVLLARQPIFDHKLNTIGYELLYRPIPSDEEGWQKHSGDLATNEVLVSAFDNIGIEHVTAGQPAYINFTEHWLNNPLLSIRTRLLLRSLNMYPQAHKM